VKFGFMVPRESDFADDRSPYDRIYAMCELAEELGFDFGTFTHHRFSPERPYHSSPFVLMSAIAARTARLKLVTTVFVLPLYHPLEVAEAVASLDQLSGGRVIFGVGTGYRPYEADAVGVPFDRRVSRLTESIEILRRAWTEQRVSFHGKHFAFDDVAVVPKPAQKPHPPIWIGALESKPVERAGRIADGWIAPSMQHLDTLRARAELYRRAAAESGRSAVICLERDAAIAPSHEQARDAWMRRNLELARYYRERGASLPDFPEPLEPLGFDQVGPGRAVAGTPEDCIRELQRCRDELGCEYLSFMNLGTGPSYGRPGSYAHELEALKLFANEVIPAFSPAGRGSAPGCRA
jgi:probable F420-dependent oxidoreductase